MDIIYVLVSVKFGSLLMNIKIISCKFRVIVILWEEVFYGLFLINIVNWEF